MSGRAIGALVLCGFGLALAACSLGSSWLATPPGLLPPGWDCAPPRRIAEFDGARQACFPKVGWHFEPTDRGFVAVRDASRTRHDRERDYDTARYWPTLSDDARRAILEGRVDIYAVTDDGRMP
jgi:hypothetical protein